MESGLLSFVEYVNLWNSYLTEGKRGSLLMLLCTFLQGFIASFELRKWQDSMSRLFQRQLERGGIIDPAHQDQVIDDSWVSFLPLLIDHHHEGGGGQICPSS